MTFHQGDVCIVPFLRVLSFLETLGGKNTRNFTSEHTCFYLDDDKLVTEKGRPKEAESCRDLLLLLMQIFC